MAPAGYDPLGEHFAAVVLELAPDGIAVTDEAGRILHANGRFEYLFGYTRDELLGHPVELLIPEQVRAAHRAHRADFGRAPATRPMGVGLDLWARHADGTEFAVEVALSPVSTGNGLRTIMAVRPVTSRRADEQAASERAVSADEDRIAGQLNDRVIRPVFAASLGLHHVLGSATDDQAAHIRVAIDELDEAIREIRAIVFDRQVPPAVIDLRRPAAGTDVGPELAGRPSVAGLVVEYRIDADDRLLSTNDGWDEFARANDAPELAGAAAGTPLWPWLAGSDVRGLWQLLVERVRATKVAARVPFRCDAPTVRRWFDMTIAAEPGGVVHFRSVLVVEEERPPVAVLDRSADRHASAAPVELCSWCGRAATDDAGWVEIEELVARQRLLEADALPRVRHSVCPPCKDLMTIELGGAGRVQGARA